MAANATAPVAVSKDAVVVLLSALCRGFDDATSPDVAERPPSSDLVSEIATVEAQLSPAELAWLNAPRGHPVAPLQRVDDRAVGWQVSRRHLPTY